MHNTIQLNNLTIGYSEKGKRRKIIAQEICATLYGGQLTCLLGKNGAGKSTLLRTLSAFIPSLEGEVVVKGKSLGEYSDKERARLIGVVLTERPELQHMTVHELVAMGRSPYTGFWGTLSKEDKAVADEALRMVGMDTMAMQMADTLSDGERQKVMIAKALAQQTPVIFLDEPTAFLDYPSKVETMLLLRRLAHETGKIIFLSTHDVELALQTADTLWLMKRVRYEESRVKTGNSSSEDSSDPFYEYRNTETQSFSYSSVLPTDGTIGKEKSSSNCKLINSSNSPLTIGSPSELADNGALESFFMGDMFMFDKDEMRFRINL